MSKGLITKKSTKKEPAKTMKEKKAAKREKKNEEGQEEERAENIQPTPRHDIGSIKQGVRQGLCGQPSRPLSRQRPMTPEYDTPHRRRSPLR